jgi:hypothetical protein
MFTIPGSGTPFEFNTPFGPVSGRAGTDVVDTTNFSAQQAVDVIPHDFDPGINPDDYSD